MGQNYIKKNDKQTENAFNHLRKRLKNNGNVCIK